MKKLLVLLITILLVSCDIAFDTCDYPVYSHQVYSHYYYYERPMFPPPYYRPVGLLCIIILMEDAQLEVIYFREDMEDEL